MPDSFLTLADLAKVNDKNNNDYGISDLLDETPVMRRLAAESADGETHKYLKEITAPTVGFRAVNTGRENSKSGDIEVTTTLKLLDCSFGVDKALADQFGKGGPEAYIAREARRFLRAGFFETEQQILYGTGNESDGFLGLADNEALDDIDDEMVVDAEGTGSDQTSVWAIRTGNDLRDMALITGMKGNIEIGESVVVPLVDSNGKRYTGYWTPIHAWLGVQIGGARSVGRIVNIDSGKPLTDDLIAKLLARFPSGRKPTFLAMSRAAHLQLQQSRTATNPTGAPAPFPTESHGIPIETTDAIGNSESVVESTTEE